LPERSLSKLLQAYFTLPEQVDIALRNIVLDSREVQPGDVFVALHGTQHHAQDFIQHAVSQGAVAILSESAAENDALAWLQNTSGKKIPLIYLSALKSKLGEILAQVYPHAELNIIGVTGTNGKTSVTHYLAQSFQHCQIKCAVMGTLGNGFPGNLQPSEFTTPDVVSCHKILSQLRAQQAQAVAMEVSSHGLAQQRVAGVNFSTAIFTNLTRDHLDYHGSMQAYAAAKTQLFLRPELRFAVLNLDDAFSQSLLPKLAPEVQVVGYSLQAHSASTIPIVQVCNRQLSKHGLHAEIDSPWGRGELHTQLIGQFNLSNLLAVLSTLCLQGVPLAQALQAMRQLIPVPGRLQLFSAARQPTLVVDYAHTPDALDNALRNLRAHCQGKLWCVFGCGGDRDAGKRELMAKVAEQQADHVVVTNDNPRTEDPQRIVDDIMRGFAQPQAVTAILDRAQAIRWAHQQANSNDMVLIAGKGHEDYQIIGDEKRYFSDIELVKGLLCN
jgi:UDP-N-acetylmuramoyl-L-alanyl-D-glutamate--2,6-diaminopimelate ligase